MCVIPAQSDVYNRKDVICSPEREWDFEDGIEYNSEYAVVLTNCPPGISFLQITEEFFISANIYTDVEEYDDGSWLLCLESLQEMNTALSHHWSFPTTAVALRLYNP